MWLLFRGRATLHRLVAEPERQEVVGGEHLMGSAGSLFQVDQLPPSAGGPCREGRHKEQDTSTVSERGEGVLDMEPRVHVAPSDSPEFPGPRAGKSLTPNCNSEEGTGVHSASPSSFAKWTSPVPQPLQEQ